jgi:tight adherence protein B
MSRRGRILSALTILTAGLLASLAAHSPIPILALPGAAAYAGRRLRRFQTRSAESAQRAAVVELCGALRAELEAGRQPGAAMTEAVWCRPELADLAAEIGSPLFAGDPADSMAYAAAIPGRRGLIALAAGWRATREHGVSLVGTVAGIEEGLRAEQHNRQGLDAELSGIRATTALLAILPLFGLALGSALGAHPVHAALHKPIGETGLAVGLLLELLGMSWTDRLIAAVEEAGSSPGRIRPPLSASIKRARMDAARRSIAAARPILGRAR